MKTQSQQNLSLNTNMKIQSQQNLSLLRVDILNLIGLIYL